MTYDPQTPIGDIALKAPESMRLFETLGLDDCCGGQLPLGAACQKAKRDAQQILADPAALERLPQDGEDPSRFASGSLTDLIAHIEAKHHAFTRQELDRLGPLVARVLGVHGERHPELAEVSRLFKALEADLRPHLEKEERILFPAIRALESGGGASPSCLRTVLGPIGVMQREHAGAGEVLARLRECTRGYEVPGDGCASFRAVYGGLQALEEDLHRHIFLENQLLFPQAVALEGRA